ncbi:hypothetical protein SAY86_014987 [Trapa natans]|uniref:Uncharacterized protein n=1 Tax=Trapa natans TaxID=22666 RepID=A0AAN7QGI1_TRANT|nr:hypothetical protein SAY86_014987 [Trapa natans]
MGVLVPFLLWIVRSFSQVPSILTKVNFPAVQVGPFGPAAGNSAPGASVHTAAKNAREDNHAMAQGHGTVTPPAAAAASGTAGAPVYAGPGTQMGPIPPRPGYDPYRVGLAYAQAGYDSRRAAGHDRLRGNYNAYRGPTYAAHSLPTYDPSRGQMYDPQSQVAPGQHMQNSLSNSTAYPNATLPPRTAGDDAAAGNPERK